MNAEEYNSERNDTPIEEDDASDQERGILEDKIDTLRKKYDKQRAEQKLNKDELIEKMELTIESLRKEMYRMAKLI